MIMFYIFTQYFYEVGAYSHFAVNAVETQRGLIILRGPNGAKTLIPIHSRDNTDYSSTHNVQYSI